MSWEKEALLKALDTTWQITPTDKNQIIFIENHDIDRFASTHPSLEKLKLGAALNLLLKGIPSIYYGQEIGMKGQFGLEKHGPHDGNAIPVREAFEWYEHWDTAGMALWYRNTGTWWDDTHLRVSDGISVEEQLNDPESLLHTYKELIALRKSHPALHSGDQMFVNNNNDFVLTFIRSTEEENYLVVVNLSR